MSVLVWSPDALYTLEVNHFGVCLVHENGISTLSSSLNVSEIGETAKLPFGGHSNGDQAKNGQAMNPHIDDPVDH